MNPSGHTEYMCVYCGMKKIQSATQGRPMPGHCPKKPKNADGSMKPHSWRVNRRMP